MKKSFRTSIGGQALLEGVMMRGPGKYAAVVRTKDGLTAKEEAAPYPKDKHPILGWVFIRGVCNFVQSMAIGMNTLFWSAEQIPIEDEEPKKGGKPDQPDTANPTKDKKPQSLGKGLLAVTALFAIALAVGLFIILPTFLGGLVSPWIGEGMPRLLFETFLKLVILLLYMILVSRTKDVQRTFSYHGAEHKSIACYEAGDDLTVDNARKHSRFHPRCGTSFLLTVILISMLVFILVSLPLQSLKWENTFLRVGVKLALLPFVVAFSYEINRLVGRTDNALSRCIRAPGLWMQRITTNEPDDAMLEVALDALKRVIPKEEGKDTWGTE